MPGLASPPQPPPAWPPRPQPLPGLPAPGGSPGSVPSPRLSTVQLGILPVWSRKPVMVPVCPARPPRQLAQASPARSTSTGSVARRGLSRSFWRTDHREPFLELGFSRSSVTLSRLCRHGAEGYRELSRGKGRTAVTTVWAGVPRGLPVRPSHAWSQRPPVGCLLPVALFCATLIKSPSYL